MGNITDNDMYEDLVLVEEQEQENYEPVEPKVSIFDLINDISQHGKFLDSYFAENGKLPKEYSSFMVNKAFANFPDTIIMANEMNKHYSLPDEMQWRFLKNTVTKRKRFSKWFKQLEEEEAVVLLARYFKCSIREMQKNMHVIPKEKQIELLKEIYPERYAEQAQKKKGSGK